MLDNFYLKARRSFAGSLTFILLILLGTHMHASSEEFSTLEHLSSKFAIFTKNNAKIAPLKIANR